jgi:hypothetical protein
MEGYGSIGADSLVGVSSHVSDTAQLGPRTRRLLVYCHNLIIVIIISGSTDLARTSAASHRRFHNLIKTLNRTPLDERSARRKDLYLHRTT